jgi:serine/threonine-protein kinase
MGARLRITVQMVNAADGYQLWSERYDREMTDVFAVQDEIASTVAARLLVTMRGDAERARVRHGTTSVEAYELFLKGRAFQYQRGGAIVTAIGCFEQAIALDPGYAEALAWMADSYRLLGTYGMAPSAEVMPRAKVAAEKALAIDPNLAEARATLADIEAQYDRDFARAAATWAVVLATDPRHVRARCERALWLVGAGVSPVAAGIEECRQAAADDPLNAWVAGMHSFALGFAGRHAEGVSEAERAMKLDPGSFFAQWGLMRAAGWAGDFARAIAMAPALLAASGRHPWALGALGWTHGKAGHAAEARAVFDELEARSRLEFVTPFWLAAAAAAAGLGEEARRYAERAVIERDPVVVLARLLPHWDGVRAMPWFEDVVNGVWG